MLGYLFRIGIGKTQGNKCFNQIRMTNFKLEPRSLLSAVDRGVSRSFLLVVFLSLGMGTFAQMRFPDALNKHLKESEYNQLYSGSDFEDLKSGSSGRAWKVWSDRDNNTVYKSLSSPNNSSDSKADWEADFMEEFVVFDVRKNLENKIFLYIKSENTLKVFVFFNKRPLTAHQ